MAEAGVGVRVREAMQRVSPTLTQAALAKAAHMTPDAMSRALSGSRGFSSIELVQIAEHLRTDVHWLITGEPDPLAAKFVARHNFDPQTREYSVAGRDDDQAILDGVHLAYRQAQPWLDEPTVRLPDTPEGVHSLLEDGFVRAFADWVEQRLGVHVVRLPRLSTDYSFIINGRPVILLAADAKWYRSNFSLAHELAHLALRHPETAGDTDSVYEAVANNFASRLLLPEHTVRSVQWGSQTDEQVALFLWRAGVSPQALKYRLTHLSLPIPKALAETPPQSPLPLLRRHQASIPRETVPNSPLAVLDPISNRMQQAAERRIPDALASALVRGAAEGGLGPHTLAWLLDLPVEEDEQDETGPEPSTDDLMEALGIRPLL